MKINNKEKKCPNCSEKINTSYISSYYISGYKTDLRPTGQCSSTPITNICRHCKYIFFDEDLKLDKKSLNDFLKSDEYQNLYLKYRSDKPFLIIYNLYKSQNKTLKEINSILLYNYYYTSKLEDLKYLVDSYMVFLETYNAKEIDEAYIDANMIIGEYYRRTSDFKKSKEIFIKIKNTTVNFKNKAINLCDFQLELIAEKNVNLEKYYNLTPNYDHKIPILDDKQTCKNLQEYSDGLFYDFIHPFHQSHRYSEFKVALNNLQEIGLNLKDSDLISSLLELFTRVNGTAAKSEIMEMIRISLFEYDVFEILYDDDGTLISYMKYYLWIDFGIIIKDVLDELREYYFQYILSHLDHAKMDSLSTDSQHILLLMQLPYYNKVSSLLKHGLKFDKDFNYKDRYDDIFDYIYGVSIGGEYGDFYEKEFIDLYKLLSLVLEEAYEIKSQRETFQRLYLFIEYLSLEEIDKLKLQVIKSSESTIDFLELFEEKNEIEIISLINQGDLEVDAKIDNEILIVTATKYACKNVVDLLLSKGMSVQTKSTREMDLLTIAASNSLNFFKYIESLGLEVDEININDILINVVHSKRYDTLMYLLSKGVDANIKVGENKISLLNLISARDNSKEAKSMIKILLNRGLDINAYDSLEDTILHKIEYAFMNIDMFEFLVKNGANPELKNSEGDTAIEHAIENLNFKISRVNSLV